MHWRGDHAAWDIQPLADVALHLRAEDGGRLGACDHVSHLGVVVCDQDLITESRDVLSEPVCVVLAEGAGPSNMDAHLFCKDLHHTCCVRCISEDNGSLPRKVLTVDGAREPSRLRHEARLLVDVLGEVELEALGLEERLDAAHETGCLGNAHGTDVHVGHAMVGLEVVRCHEANLTVGNDVEPGAWELVKIMDTGTLGHDEVRLDAHVT
mmetsp:Transcript_51466/g.111636  ORF Transcript_51466/g.111636 Transcript_51466/m.111636 type:complete len:210 (-) Transcript_51466:974-1603(-)